MKTSSLGIALLASVAVGCSDSAAGPGSATPSDLAGVWLAVAYTVTNVANTSLSAELVVMGLSLSLTITETSYAGIVTFPGEPTEDFSGTYTIDGQSLILDELGEVELETMIYSLSGSVLTLSGNDDEYDFDDDGQDEPATFVIVLDKQ